MPTSRSARQPGPPGDPALATPRPARGGPRWSRPWLIPGTAALLWVGCQQPTVQAPEVYSWRASELGSTVLQKVSALDGAAQDFFGQAVSVQDELAIIGSPQDSDAGASSGSAYLFTKSGTVWVEHQKLTAGDGAALARFGAAVSIDTDLVLVGAPGESARAPGAGAVYVFASNGTVWDLEQKLTAADGGDYDYLGRAVHLEDQVALVGSPGDDDRGAEAGAAYVFGRTGTTWGEVQKLTATDGVAGDGFGAALSGFDRSALVGAAGRDDRGSDAGAGYLFYRSAGGVWAQLQKLTASDGAAGDGLGGAVSLAEESALLGAGDDDDLGTGSGSAYLFARSGTVWSEARKLTADDGAAGDAFGARLALHQEVAVVGAQQDDDRGVDSGSIYVFSRTGTIWFSMQKLTADDGAAGAAFGGAVAVGKNMALVGAHLDDNKGTDSGSAYFVPLCTERGWTQKQQLNTSGGSAEDYFGISVSLSGDQALVGVPYDDDLGGDSGSAYIYSSSGTVWSQADKLVPTNGEADDRFGTRVALQGDVALVGAEQDDDRGTVAGAAYVFARSGTAWSQTRKLTAKDGAAGDFLGRSVALGEGVALLGAPYDNDQGKYSGSAYVFTRSGTVWNYTQKLHANFGKAYDEFGWAVAVEDDWAVVGARWESTAGTTAGAAYVFSRSGTTWTQRQRLTAADASAADEFGQEVAISDKTLMISAPFDDDKGGSAGAVYIYTRTGMAFKPLQKLTASDGSTNDVFGTSVALSGDSAVVGADADDVRGVNAGAVYLFTRSGTVWREQQKLTADNGKGGDGFGVSVAATVGLALIGSYKADTGGLNAGSAYFFSVACPLPQGVPCPGSWACESKNCVDGVCCNEFCGGGQEDCQRCSEAAGAQQDGVCEAYNKGYTCRAPENECDVLEKCTGTDKECPADVFQPNGTSCLGGSGVCMAGKCSLLPDAGLPDGGPDAQVGPGPDLGADGRRPLDLGAGEAPGADAGPVDGDDGCACEAAAPGAAGGAWLALLAALALALRRGRRQPRGRGRAARAALGSRDRVTRKEDGHV